MSLSVIIITLNEENNIKTCLESVKFADEIIIIDSGSDDQTIEISKQYTDKITQTNWPGFGKQKNCALEQATKDWVLSIDADEHLSTALQSEIKSAIEKTEYAAYKIPRASKYCGKTIKHGAWRNDKVIRLFQQGRAQFTDAEVHERLVVNGRIGELKGVLQHDSFQDLTEVLHKVNHYSSAGAKQKAKQNKHSSLSKAIFRGLWTFIRDYLIKRGFLDGREGFMLAVSNAEGCYYRYLKLYYLTQQKPQTTAQQNTQT